MKRNRTEHFTASGVVAPASQCAALCWRMHRSRVQVLLISSRDTGRWVIPKGWPIDGKTLSETAAREAWEEAGVKGDVSSNLLGLYGYDKTREPHPALPCVVTVFPLRVAGLARKFPERGQRRRKWFDAVKAARKVAEPDLRTLLENLDWVEGDLVNGTKALQPA